MWGAIRSANQAERSTGFLAGKITRMSRNVFWTVTVWETEAAMNGYRVAGAHLRAMPKLKIVQGQSSVVHAEVESNSSAPTYLYRAPPATTLLN